MLAAVSALAVPTASVTLPAGTLTSTMPVLSAVGVTTSVALVPDSSVNAPLVPPVTTTSSAVNEVPTSRLNEKVNVIGPVAVSAVMSLVIVTTGAPGLTTLPGDWGGASPLPPPQAASERANTAAAVAARDGVNRRVVMVGSPCKEGSFDRLRCRIGGWVRSWPLRARCCGPAGPAAPAAAGHRRSAR